jgi:tetratricopeptide (TPR) repeat protein
MGTKKPKGRKPREEVTTEPDSGNALPEPGSMERAMAELSRILGRGGSRGRKATRDTRYRAQELIYDAWEAPRIEDRIRLAEEALGLWSDCADAYNLLAEEKSESITEARFYFEKGVEAGARALGRKAFKEDVGHFWGILETRPYMRARAGLAECLWRLGEEEQALDHYQEMLRLNPNDNQGVRDLLLSVRTLSDGGWGAVFCGALGA